MRCNWCVVVPALSPQRPRCSLTHPTMTDNTAQERQMNYRPDTTETTVRMGTIAVEGLNIFSREARRRRRSAAPAKAPDGASGVGWSGRQDAGGVMKEVW